MKLFVYASLVLGMCAGFAVSAEVSPSFDLELFLSQNGEFVSGIVILESPIDIRALDLSLHARGAKKAERYAEIYGALQSNARQTQPKFRAELEAGKEVGLVEGYTAYWLENMFVVSAKSEFFNALRNRGDIRGLSENFEAVLIEPIRSIDPNADNEMHRPNRNPLDEETTTPGQDAIGATRVNRELGITGQGVLVANLDTGVDGDHGALASRWRGLTAPASAAWLDVLNATPSSFPTDNNSHGTHVMGTICGREILANGDTLTVGSAPDAEWIACNAIDQGVSAGFNNDVLNAYQWFANPDGDSTTLNDVPDVVQNSWGVNQNFPGYTQCWDLWNTTIVNLEALGCVVTFSAGNEGPAATSHRSPAIHAFSEVQMFSVGAADVPAGDTPPYAIAGFSSRGPSPCAGTFIKPEIVAPGVNINSSVPGGGYNAGFSGTSMAGPHVAGIVALMRQACPDCDAITIKEALLATAIDSGYGETGNDNTFGYGFIDGYEAVSSVFNLGSVAGVVSIDNSPLEGVDIVVVENQRSDVTDTAGVYRIALSSGVYTLQFSKFAYLPVTITDVSIVEGDTTELDVPITLAPVGVVSGRVYDSGGAPVVGATVQAMNVPVPIVTTDDGGNYQLTLPAGDTYTLQALGTRGASSSTFLLTADTTIHFYMPTELFCYDFEASNQGWTVGGAGDNATNGVWGRMDPEETIDSGAVCQPGDDHTVAGINCFVTNGIAGIGAGANDIDGGKTTLLSPIWDLSSESNVVFEAYRWYSNDNGNNPGEDYFDVDVSNNGGTSWVSMQHDRVDSETWQRKIFLLEDYVPLSNQMRVRFVAQDQPLGSLVEAAIDDVCILASGILPPEELTLLVIESGMQLNWQAVQGAASYTIWRGLEFPPTLENTIILASVSATSYIDVTNLDTLGFYIITANR